MKTIMGLTGCGSEDYDQGRLSWPHPSKGKGTQDATGESAIVPKDRITHTQRLFQSIFQYEYDKSITYLEGNLARAIS